MLRNVDINLQQPADATSFLTSTALNKPSSISGGGMPTRSMPMPTTATSLAPPTTNPSMSMPMMSIPNVQQHQGGSAGAGAAGSVSAPSVGGNGVATHQSVSMSVARPPVSSVSMAPQPQVQPPAGDVSSYLTGNLQQQQQHGMQHPQPFGIVGATPNGVVATAATNNNVSAFFGQQQQQHQPQPTPQQQTLFGNNNTGISGTSSSAANRGAGTDLNAAWAMDHWQQKYNQEKAELARLEQEEAGMYQVEAQLKHVLLNDVRQGHRAMDSELAQLQVEWKTLHAKEKNFLQTPPEDLSPLIEEAHSKFQQSLQQLQHVEGQHMQLKQEWESLQHITTKKESQMRLLKGLQKQAVAGASDQQQQGSTSTADGAAATAVADGEGGLHQAFSKLYELRDNFRRCIERVQTVEKNRLQVTGTCLNAMEVDALRSGRPPLGSVVATAKPSKQSKQITKTAATTASAVVSKSKSQPQQQQQVFITTAPDNQNQEIQQQQPPQQQPQPQLQPPTAPLSIPTTTMTATINASSSNNNGPTKAKSVSALGGSSYCLEGLLPLNQQQQQQQQPSVPAPGGAHSTSSSHHHRSNSRRLLPTSTDIRPVSLAGAAGHAAISTASAAIPTSSSMSLPQQQMNYRSIVSEAAANGHHSRSQQNNNAALTSSSAVPTGSSAPGSANTSRTFQQAVHQPQVQQQLQQGGMGMMPLSADGSVTFSGTNSLSLGLLNNTTGGITNNNSNSSISSSMAASMNHHHAATHNGVVTGGASGHVSSSRAGSECVAGGGDEGEEGDQQMIVTDTPDSIKKIMTELKQQREQQQQQLGFPATKKYRNE